MGTMRVMAKATGVCPVCELRWPLRKDGTLYKHPVMTFGAAENYNCYGSWSRPESR